MSQDPYRYFRIEARELVAEMGKEALALERDAPSPARVAHLLRLAHTLKGAARVVKQREIADHAHAMEDALSPHRESGGPVPRGGVNAVLGLIDQIGGRVASLDAPAVAAGDAVGVRSQPEGSFRTLRAETGEVEELLDGMVEMQTRLAQLGGSLEGFERVCRLATLLSDEVAATPTTPSGRPGSDDRRRARDGSVTDDLLAACQAMDRSMTSDVEQMERQLREVRRSAERLRLVAASAMFTPLERAARDVAQTQGKQVVFEGAGGELRLDAHVLGIAQPALLQIVRNAVAHGIESAAERAAAGKAPAGRVRIEVARRGQRVRFVCRDDGRGIDFDAVRRSVEARGLSPADAAAMGPEALLQVLLAGGISTASTVSEMSGRGIGLDVVRDAAERLGGDVAVRSEPGAGTVVEIDAPLSLASIEALMVEGGGAVAAIPLDAIRSTVHLEPGAIARSGRGDTITSGGRVIPFLPLARALDAGGPGRATGSWSAVLIEGPAGWAAIGVDRLLGTGSILLRPLPELCPAAPIVAGVTIDADGNPRLVLDPHGLVVEAMRAERAPVEEAVAARPILVIDDSLTTRMLEQSILESAGYEVAVAVSAEEGLERARRERFALFLVDVEMPGMDGFAFIERTRADPGLRDIPAILVTSRAGPDDRRRGEEVGACGFIVKSEFNQGELLRHIRTLVG
jgi:two-component system, chemotaxis family, sensor kinase CheA